MDRQVVARHEAGHAVVAIATGAIVGEIDLLAPNPITRLALFVPVDPWVQGLIALGGCVAEGHDRLGGKLDQELFVEALRGIGGDPELAGERLLSCARLIVERNEEAVAAVAAALCLRPRISGHTVKRIAFRASPVLRDLASPFDRKVVASIRARAA